MGVLHFDQLSNITRQKLSGTYFSNGYISKDDIDFAEAMDQGKTMRSMLEGAADDTMAGIGMAAAGATGSVIGAYELASGTSMLGGAASAAIAFGWVGVGVIGVAAAGYFGYEALTTYGRVNQASANDQKMFKEWIAE